MPAINKKRVKQDPPFAMQIELVEGCNLRCSFCGLNGIRGKDNDFKHMTIELADRIVDSIIEAGWNPRIEFAMHGEPSMNPDMIDILQVFRDGLPAKTHMMMTSNGAGFLSNPTLLIDEVLEHINVLAIDWYQSVNIVPKLLKMYRGEHQVRYYPDEDDANPHRRRNQKEHDLVIVRDISQTSKGTHSTLNNHAGSGAPKNDKAQGKRCAKPFRELSIRWDGNVAICCNDWRGEYKVGNVSDESVEEIWQSERMEAARRRLYRGMRDFGPCEGCDALSYRTGLLPDKFGKEEMPEPDGKSEAAIQRALAGRPYTEPVLRVWELQ